MTARQVERNRLHGIIAMKDGKIKELKAEVKVWRSMAIAANDSSKIHVAEVERLQKALEQIAMWPSGFTIDTSHSEGKALHARIGIAKAALNRSEQGD